MMNSYNEPKVDKWFPHFGGDCPAPLGTTIDVRYADGEWEDRLVIDHLAYRACWEHYGVGSDIIAWRYHNDYEEAVYDQEIEQLAGQLASVWINIASLTSKEEINDRKKQENGEEE